MRGRRQLDHDDPEHRGRTAAARYDDLPLFSGLANPGAFPTAPVVQGVEQRSLQLPHSIDERYESWRRTEDGQRAFRVAHGEALGQIARGATRLFIDQLVWVVRGGLGLSLDNSFRALLVRELEETDALCRGLFETRQRRSAS